MTLDEVAALLAVCAAYDARTVGPTDLDAWEAIVGDVTFADARDAALAHYSESRDRVMPVDIRQRVRAMRLARLENVQDIDLVRDVDPDDPHWHRILQGRRQALMDGLPLEQAKAIPARSAVLAIGGAR
jgi:hypothetical protein